MTAVIIRIALRYLAGALVAKGFLSPEDGSALAMDSELAQLLEVGAGLALGAAVEGFYYLANRFGWAK